MMFRATAPRQQSATSGVTLGDLIVQALTRHRNGEAFVAFDTGLLDKTLGRQPELSKARLASGIPVGRIDQPWEFADLATTSVSPRMGYVTGLVAPVDGGSGIGIGVTFDSADPTTGARQ